ITHEKDNTPTRKIKEMMRALALEKELSKDEILTMYLNIAYFANNCNGVEAAARTYFNKNASDLTLAEAASIAGITQFPSEFDPFVHPENNIEKRNLVLGKMKELGYITDAQYNEASASDLVVSNAYRENSGRITSYFVDQVINDVVNDLVEQKGYSTDFATRQVYNGGLTIYATIDPDIQNTMESVFTDYSNFPSTGKGAQSAMVVTDPYTGQVKGLIGGLGEKTNIRGWNRATQMKRQPGSSIKPLSVYGPAIDTGKITEVTEVVDEEITIGDDKWKPKNAYSGFLGEMTVKEAVSRSANIPAVKVLDMVGVSTSFNYLQKKFHLSSIEEQDRNYSSLALGGLTQGVSVEEMAAAYGTFVNSGQYIKPHTYTKVLDAKGDIVLSNSSDTT
ncbi:MAG: transglycosylase domain-containing protein, partial [Clostridia bacterium]|nr:transglycosylase domain-containing protein [Clostridia bacterium]